MKAISNKLVLLAIAGIGILAVIGIQSCKKSSSPSGPSVTSTSLASGATITAGNSTTVTITGANLSGATVTSSTAGVTISNVSVSGSTSITATVAIGASVQSGSITLTITTANGTTNTTITVVGIPVIGGYISSDSVAASNLIAYWPFDGDVNDHSTDAIPGTGVNVTYVPGLRGQAYQGSTTSYASFTPSAKMTALQSFTLSVWYWQTAQPVGTPNTPQGIFFLADAGGADPLIILENEHYAPVSGDSLRFHAGLSFTAATNYKGFTMETFDTAALGKWVNLVMTYNGGTSTYVVYQNAQPMLNSSAYGSNLSTILLDGPGGASPASNPQGNLNWANTPPVEGTIGTWAPGVYGVSPTLGSNGNWVGQLDELRLYNRALTQLEVTGLFLNGQAGR